MKRTPVPARKRAGRPGDARRTSADARAASGARASTESKPRRQARRRLHARCTGGGPRGQAAGSSVEKRVGAWGRCGAPSRPMRSRALERASSHRIGHAAGQSIRMTIHRPIRRVVKPICRQSTEECANACARAGFFDEILCRAGKRLK
ncbi:conserved hypothetical protein [Burkholderia pseudomallei S13]|nr:conserved hypothetical protein [Burkholderia pseudomallei S13]